MVNGEYFEEDDKTNVKNEEKSFLDFHESEVGENVENSNENSQRTKACHICEKTFKTRHTLEIHIQSIHLGVKYTCDLCDAEFTQKKSLKKHIESVHEKIKYACNLCDHQASSL